MSVQLVGQAAFPVFCLYWYFVMLESLGSVQESDTCALPAVAVRPIGLAGTVVVVCFALPLTRIFMTLPVTEVHSPVDVETRAR